MLVKVIGIDRATGKIRLSRREALGKTPGRRPQLPRRRRFVTASVGWLRPGSGSRSCARARRRRATCRPARRGWTSRPRPTSRSRSRPAGRVAVPTGLAFEIPPGFEGQVRPRSGLARKFGITLPNAPGTIDSDYRGEVQVLLANLGAEAYVVKPGDRIAQLVIAPVVHRRARGGRVAGRQRPRRRAASATPAAETPERSRCIGLRWMADE